MIKANQIIFPMRKYAIIKKSNQLKIKQKQKMQKIKKGIIRKIILTKLKQQSKVNKLNFSLLN